MICLEGIKKEFKKERGRKDSILRTGTLNYCISQCKSAVKYPGGGHINWLNKLRLQFPNWTYIPTEDYRVVDGKMLEQKERAYFYTNHMSHITYHKFIAVVRERKIPFGYLRSINLEKMVQQIYEEFENDK